MNLRQLKKASKRAALKLAAEFPGQYDISPSDGGETLDRPHRVIRSRSESPGFITPMRGTPLVWRRASYEYDEWDCIAASSVYRDRLADERDYFRSQLPANQGINP